MLTGVSAIAACFRPFGRLAAAGNTAAAVTVLAAGKSGAAAAAWTVLGRPRACRFLHCSSDLRSVSGQIYQVLEGKCGRENAAAVKVTLYTKEGCTLCDDATDVLRQLRTTHPHSLDAVDITDAEHAGWHSMYKYDIPVLHLDGMYWIKHRVTSAEAGEGLALAAQGVFEAQKGQPDAERLEGLAGNSSENKK